LPIQDFSMILSENKTADLVPLILSSTTQYKVFLLPHGIVYSYLFGFYNRPGALTFVYSEELLCRIGLYETVITNAASGRLTNLVYYCLHQSILTLCYPLRVD
jgi:hypothetical protein